MKSTICIQFDRKDLRSKYVELNLTDRFITKSILECILAVMENRRPVDQ